MHLDGGTIEVIGTELVDEPPGHEGVYWCPNLLCPSNRALIGFLRVSPNQYQCDVCDEIVIAHVGRVLKHRSLHSQTNSGQSRPRS